MASKDKDAGALGIQSIEVGLKLLRPMIDAGGPMTLKALSEAAGYAPPKAHRYLVSLIRMKLAYQDPMTGLYGLGELAFELGLAAIGLLDRDALGRRAVCELCEETRHTACLVVWANGGATVAAFDPGIGSIFLGIRVGSILSLLRSASGRVFLSYMPRESVADVLKRELAEMRLQSAAADEIVEKVRREGVSRVRDTMMVGLSAVAAPVFDHDGRLLYVLTALGQTESFDTSLKGATAGIVRNKAMELSTRLGFKPESAKSISLSHERRRQ
jgi:DNA-binding IclR family transcriptional regulator